MRAALHKLNHPRDSHGSSSMVIYVQSFPPLQHKFTPKCKVNLLCFWQ
jgi:hypothetical protein